MDKRERLNRLGVEWYNTPDEGNEAVKAGLQNQIFLLAMELFPRQKDALGLFFLADWTGRAQDGETGEQPAKARFDPSKGPLYEYMKYRLERRMTDLWKKDNKGVSRRAPLDAPLGADGGEGAWADIIPGDADVDDRQLNFQEAVMELMLLMLRLKDNLKGQAGNSTRINYFRLFFTDGMVNVIHTDSGPALFARRERDLFQVIKVSFLDFFMSRPCRDVAAIAYAGLKPYGQMVEKRPMTPPKQPLPNDVYTTYLKQVEHRSVTESAVSRQRATYLKFFREHLQC